MDCSPHTVPLRSEARGDSAAIRYRARHEAGRQVQAELQDLADRLAAGLGMPDGMVVRIGYRDDRTINAFATIGGQAVISRAADQAR